MKSIYALENAVRSYGYEFIYAFPESAQDREWCKDLAKRSKVYFLPLEKARIRLLTYQKLKRVFIDNPDITIVHSHFELYDLPLSIVCPKKVKLFWHLHDPLTVGKRIKNSRDLLALVQYKYCSRRAILISVAKKYKNDIVNIGFREKNAFVVENGIDLDRIKLQQNDRSKEYTFLSYVWDFYRKGGDILLKACDRLITNGYDCKVLLIGNQDAITYIEKNYPNRVSDFIVQGADPDVNNYLSKSHIFVSSSRKETFSYAVCEAAYAGLPVISSDIYGLEWAYEVPSVFFFESENVDSLYNTMVNCLNNHQLDDNVSRTVISEKYSTSAWCKRIIEIYGINQT